MAELWIFISKGSNLTILVELNHIRKAALKMRAGGVGYYPNTNFVNIDTGPVRKW